MLPNFSNIRNDSSDPRHIQRKRKTFSLGPFEKISPSRQRVELSGRLPSRGRWSVQSFANDAIQVGCIEDFNCGKSVVFLSYFYPQKPPNEILTDSPFSKIPDFHLLPQLSMNDRDSSEHLLTSSEYIVKVLLKHVNALNKIWMDELILHHGPDAR